MWTDNKELGELIMQQDDARTVTVPVWALAKHLLQADAELEYTGRRSDFYSGHRCHEPCACSVLNTALDKVLG